MLEKVNIVEDIENRLTLILELPLPPTDNSIYISINIGSKPRRILSNAAKKFKNQIKVAIARVLIENSGRIKDADFFNNESIYVFKISTYFECIENKGWPKKAKYRFKKIDLTNRNKLLIDSICENLNIDDSQIFKVLLEKKKGVPRVIVHIYKGEKDGQTYKE
jgi:hypothetical protein